jgi:hypothetical protein
MFKSRLGIVLIAGSAVLVLAALFYAFAAANIVPETGAGVGSGTITGYTITNVTYTLDNTDPSLITAVDFDLVPTAGANPPQVVYVKLIEPGGSWYSCAVAAGAASCTISPGISASSANTLTVSAAQ